MLRRGEDVEKQEKMMSWKPTRRTFVLAAGAFAGSASAMNVKDFRRLGLDQTMTDQPFDLAINGRSNMEIMQALNVPADAQYNPCREANPGPDVPRGEMLKFPAWAGSKVYRKTRRDIWIYVPKQVKTGVPSLMIFNDGLGYADPAGAVRAPAVLDSLIHSGELPPTVGIFVMPGQPVGKAADQQASGRQRSFEYDSLTGNYANFLTREVIPFVEKETGLTFNADPSQRTVVGISSGGICAFNAAWYNPGAFGRVLSHCGSFTNIRGGHNYPYLVRTTERKPIRILLTSGSNDANIPIGSWPHANKSMAAALEYAGYESRFVFGEGGHSLRHGGAIFADSLRWLAAQSNPSP
jgi:enterochelin esterase family protein